MYCLTALLFPGQPGTCTNSAYFLLKISGSVDPAGSPYRGYAEGKISVRKKGGDFVKKIQDFHGASTTEPVTGGTHFAVGREMDITVEGFGRIQLNEIMLYEVQDGAIVTEQFFY